MKSRTEYLRQYRATHKEQAARRSARYRAEHPGRNAAAVKRAGLKRYAAVRQFLDEYLSAHPCVDCGETDIEILEFDHVKGEKKFRVGNIASRSWPVVLREIDKCEVRCHKCHKRVTALRRAEVKATRAESTKTKHDLPSQRTLWD